MPQYVIDTLKPKNNNNFPVAEAVDVLYEEGSTVKDKIIAINALIVAAQQLIEGVQTDISELQSTKVDKVSGKGLSTNDFTNAYKDKIDDTYTKSETDTALAGKVDKVSGKGLSTNDFTNTYKNKVDNTYTKTETDSAITTKIAEVVASAPEDLNTLKEIADWIDTHADSASAMNSAIQANAANIEKKVDKVEGKTLSSNDFTDVYKNKVDNTYIKAEVDSKLKDKVDKENGKGLSTNDFTDEYQTRVHDAYANTIENASEIEKLKSNKADKTSLSETNQTIENNRSNLQGQIDTLVLESGGDSNLEIVQARVGRDGTTHDTLKSRLDAMEGDMLNDINTLSINVDTFKNDVNSSLHISDDIVIVEQDGYSETAIYPVDIPKGSEVEIHVTSDRVIQHSWGFLTEDNTHVESLENVYADTHKRIILSDDVKSIFVWVPEPDPSLKCKITKKSVKGYISDNTRYVSDCVLSQNEVEVINEENFTSTYTSFFVDIPKNAEINIELTSDGTIKHSFDIHNSNNEKIYSIYGRYMDYKNTIKLNSNISRISVWCESVDLSLKFNVKLKSLRSYVSDSVNKLSSMINDDRTLIVDKTGFVKGANSIVLDLPTSIRKYSKIRVEMTNVSTGSSVYIQNESGTTLFDTTVQNKDYIGEVYISDTIAKLGVYCNENSNLLNVKVYMYNYNYDMMEDIELNLSQGLFDGTGINIYEVTTTVCTPVINLEGLYIVTFPDEYMVTYNLDKIYSDGTHHRENFTSNTPISVKISGGSDFTRFSFTHKDGTDVAPETAKNDIKFYKLAYKNTDYVVSASDSVKIDKKNSDIVLDGTNDTKILCALAGCTSDISVKLMDGTYNITEYWSVANNTAKVSISYNDYRISNGYRKYIKIYGNKFSNPFDIGGVKLKVSEALHESYEINDTNIVLGQGYDISKVIDGYGLFVSLSNFNIIGYSYDKNVTYVDNTRCSVSLIEGVNVWSDASITYSAYKPFGATPHPECTGIRVGKGGNFGIQNSVKHLNVWYCGKGIACSGEHFVFEDVKVHHDYIGFVFGDRNTTGRMEHPNIMIGCSIESCYRLMQLSKLGVTEKQDFVRNYEERMVPSTLICIGLSTENRWDIPTSEIIEGEATSQITKPIDEILTGCYRGRIEADWGSELFEKDGSGKNIIETTYAFNKIVDK